MTTDPESVAGSNSAAGEAGRAEFDPLPPGSERQARALRSTPSYGGALARWTVRLAGLPVTGYFVLYGVAGLGAGHGTALHWDAVFAPFSLEGPWPLLGPVLWLVVFGCAPSRIAYLRALAAALLVVHCLFAARQVHDGFFAPTPKTSFPTASFGPPPVPLSGEVGVVHTCVLIGLGVAILWPRTGLLRRVLGKKT